MDRAFNITHPPHTYTQMDFISARADSGEFDQAYKSYISNKSLCTQIPPFNHFQYFHSPSLTMLFKNKCNRDELPTCFHFYFYSIAPTIPSVNILWSEENEKKKEQVWWLVNDFKQIKKAAHTLKAFVSLFFDEPLPDAHTDCGKKFIKWIGSICLWGSLHYQGIKRQTKPRGRKRRITGRW